MASAMITTISPSTGEPIVERPETTLEEAHKIVRDSYDAFVSYRKMPLLERKSIVEKALSLIEDRKEQLGRELTMQMGRPISFSTKEIDTMQKRARYLLSICEDSLAEIPGQPEAGFRRYIKKEPVGPTLLVFAWNASIHYSLTRIHLTDVYVTVSLPNRGQLADPRPPRRQHSHLKAFAAGPTRRRASRRDLR